MDSLQKLNIISLTKSIIYKFAEETLDIPKEHRVVVLERATAGKIALDTTNVSIIPLRMYIRNEPAQTIKIMVDGVSLFKLDVDLLLSLPIIEEGDVEGLPLQINLEKLAKFKLIPESFRGLKYSQIVFESKDDFALEYISCKSFASVIGEKETFEPETKNVFVITRVVNDNFKALSNGLFIHGDLSKLENLSLIWDDERIFELVPRLFKYHVRHISERLYFIHYQPVLSMMPAVLTPSTKPVNNISGEEHLEQIFTGKQYPMSFSLMNIIKLFINGAPLENSGFKIWSSCINFTLQTDGVIVMRYGF